jgi:hypothetical protein
MILQNSHEKMKYTFGRNDWKNEISRQTTKTNAGEVSFRRDKEKDRNIKDLKMNSERLKSVSLQTRYFTYNVRVCKKEGFQPYQSITWKDVSKNEWWMKSKVQAFGIKKIRLTLIYSRKNFLRKLIQRSRIWTCSYYWMFNMKKNKQKNRVCSSHKL